MYIELLAADNFISVNRKLASLYGLHTAVYIAELSNIIRRVVAKQTATPEGFFPLDRAYIEERTTLSAEAQHACDRALNKLGVVMVNPENDNSIKVDMGKLVGILLEDDPETLKLLAQKTAVTKEDQAAAKALAQKTNIKRTLEFTDEALKAAADAWVDTIFERGHGVSTKRVSDFITQLNKYTTDPAKQLELLTLAAQYGYLVFTNLRKHYESLATQTSVTMLGDQKTVIAVSDQKF